MTEANDARKCQKMFERRKAYTSKTMKLQLKVLDANCQKYQDADHKHKFFSYIYMYHNHSHVNENSRNKNEIILCLLLFFFSFSLSFVLSS